MLYREEDFWEKERNCPLFNRSGLISKSNLIMILPKFRNMLRMAKLLNNSNDLTFNNQTIYEHYESGSFTDNDVNKLLKDLNNLKVTNDNTNTNKDNNENNNNNNKENNTDKKKEENKDNKVAPVEQELTDEEDIKYEVPEDTKRIFRLDAERTFVNEFARDKFNKNLCLVYEKIGDYHQGEGFLIALLSIYLRSYEVVFVMDVFNRKLLPGYFSSKPKNYVRDSRVLMKLLNTRNPKLAEKMDSLIVPEAFVSKWFIGLNVHVFDFETVSTCLNYLFEQGQVFLFKLGLSFFNHYSEEILKTNDVSYVLQLLRLDDSVLPKTDLERSYLYNKILVGSFDQEVTDEEINELRSEVEKQMLEEEERRNRLQAMLDDDEIVFSDEE